MVRFRGMMMAFLLVIFIADIASLPPELPVPSIWPILGKLCPGGGGDGGGGTEGAGGDAQGAKGCIDPSSAGGLCKTDALGVSAADLRAAASYLAWLAEEEGCSGSTSGERIGEREMLHAVDQVGQGEGVIEEAGEGNEGIQELRDTFRIISPSNGTLYDPNSFRDGELKIWIEVDQSHASTHSHKERRMSKNEKGRGLRNWGVEKYVKIQAGGEMEGWGEPAALGDDFLTRQSNLTQVETGRYPIGFPSGGGLLAYFSGDQNDGRSLRPIYNRCLTPR